MESMDVSLNNLFLGPALSRAAASRRVGIVARVDTETAEALAGLPAEVAWLRMMGEGAPPRKLRERLAGGLILGCTGRNDDSRARRERLLRSTDGYDLVELEGDRDLSEDVLATIPPHRRLIGWRGPAAHAADLLGVFRRLSAIQARYYRIVVEGRTVHDGLAPLELLRMLGRRDVVAYADGEAGLWSRILAPLLGAPLIFGAFGEGPERGDDPDVRRLVEDYGFPEVPAATTVYGIVGDRVSGSLSPRLHNAAYRSLGIPALFLPFPAESFGRFWTEMVASPALERAGVPLRGLTVASPYKADAAALADRRSAVVERVGAANLVYRRRDGWVAESSDPPGVLHALPRHGLTCAGLTAAVVGCGGSGRAIADALKRAGATVVLSNRDRTRGEWAARRLGLPLVPLSEFSVAGFDLVVNATPVGKRGEGLPFDVGRLGRDSAVVDLVYADGTTPLVAAARDRGATVIEGREVLMIQAMRQFVRMTGRPMSEPLAASILGLSERRPGRGLSTRETNGGPLHDP